MPAVRVALWKGIAAGVVAVSVAACGEGNATVLGTAPQPPTTTPSAGTTASAGATPSLAAITEQVRVASPTATWGPTISAPPGESVQFRTVLGRSAPDVVRFQVVHGPGNSETVTATAGGHSSQAIVKGTAGSHLTLVALRYTCAAPPAPSFCPISDVGTTASGSSFAFHDPAHAPVFLTATVGPTNLPGLQPTPTSRAVVPPYKAVLLGRSITPGTSASKSLTASLGSSVTVKPGTVLLLTAQVQSGVKGAPQRLRISFGQGPAASLTASASVPGGTPSEVHIKSSDGLPITLVLPRYSCYVPPIPTDCPPVEAGNSGRGYTLEFRAAPGRPAVSLLTSVEGG